MRHGKKRFLVHRLVRERSVERLGVFHRGTILDEGRGVQRVEHGAIARLGERMLQNGEGVDAAEALPVYIRDDVARPARPPVTGLS